MHALKRACVVTAVALFSVSASSLAGADEPLPSPDPVSGDDKLLYEDDGSLHVLPEHGFPGRRWTQVRMGLTALGSSAFIEGQDLRAMAGGRWYWSPRLAEDTPSVEAGLMGGFYGGSFGIRDNSGFVLEAGGNVRFRFNPHDFIVWYMAVDTTMLWATSTNQVAFRGDIGPGIELGRILTAEVTLTGMASKFESNGHESPFSLGPSGTLSFDFCSVARANACEYDPPQAQLDDQTCLLYHEANRLCSVEAPKVKQSNLCAVVDEALNTFEHPLLGRDPVTAFLESALEQANAEAARILRPLLDLHIKQRSWQADGRQAKREAVIAKKHLAVTRRYAPYPVEIAHALGCDGATSCEDVCASR